MFVKRLLRFLLIISLRAQRGDLTLPLAFVQKQDIQYLFHQHNLISLWENCSYGLASVLSSLSIPDGYSESRASRFEKGLLFR